MKTIDDVLARLREHTDTRDPASCWIWGGRTDPDGYGRLHWKGLPSELAHRAVYLAFGRVIPDGMELDHLCRTRACVNPDHLEPVSRHENNLRMHAQRYRRRTCKRGHALSEDNIYSGPNHDQHRCLTCKRSRERRASARYAAKHRTPEPASSTRSTS